MRIFAAVLPPAEAAAELAAAVARLRQLPGADQLRWTDRAGWHLTLAFYGDNDPATVREVTERLARAARRTPPFPVRLYGAGQFGERALWAARRPATLVGPFVSGRISPWPVPDRARRRCGPSAKRWTSWPAPGGRPAI